MVNYFLFFKEKPVNYFRKKNHHRGRNKESKTTRKKMYEQIE